MKSLRIVSNSALSSGALTHIVQDGLSATINILLPVLAQSFGLSYAQVGLLRGLKSVVQSVVEMGSGWISERIGESQTLVIGLICSGIGYALMSFASGLVLVTAGLFVVGVGTALHHAPSSSLIASHFGSGNRSSALGLYNASGDVGKLSLSGGFSFAMGVGLAWHQASFLYAGLTLLATFAVAVLSAQIRSKAKEAQAENADADATSGISRWGVLDWRSFGVLLATICIDNMVQTSVLVFTAFLMLSKGLPIWLATGSTVLLLVGGVVGVHHAQLLVSVGKEALVALDGLLLIVTGQQDVVDVVQRGPGCGQGLVHLSHTGAQASLELVVGQGRKSSVAKVMVVVGGVVTGRGCVFASFGS